MLDAADPDVVSTPSPIISSSLQTPNSLPSPIQTSSRPETPSTAPRPSAPTLQYAFNPQHSRRPSAGSLSSRRQSLLTPPLPLESSSPGPQRLPRQKSSDFAELHNELEIEQEAAVNRLLNMIRLQNQQLQQLPGTDDALMSPTATLDSSSATRARSPAASGRHIGLSRQNSFNNRRTQSRASSTHTASPSLQPIAPLGSDSLGVHGNDTWLLGGSRDEASFYLAETQMLTRENEMLKRRVQELEKQLQEVKKLKAARSIPTSDAS